MWNYFNKRVKQMNLWDIGILKIYVMAIGLVAGAYFPTLVKNNIWILGAIIVVTLVYLMYMLFIRKNKE